MIQCRGHTLRQKDTPHIGRHVSHLLLNALVGITQWFEHKGFFVICKTFPFRFFGTEIAENRTRRTYSPYFKYPGKWYIPLAKELQKSKVLLRIPCVLHERGHGLKNILSNVCGSRLLDGNVFVAFGGFLKYRRLYQQRRYEVPSP